MSLGRFVLAIVLSMTLPRMLADALYFYFYFFGSIVHTAKRVDETAILRAKGYYFFAGLYIPLAV